MGSSKDGHGKPSTPAATSRIQAIAKANAGKIPGGNFAARPQSAAARNFGGGGKGRGGK